MSDLAKPPRTRLDPSRQRDAGWPVERLPIVLVGPTAVGKTAVAVELAERIGGEIVNADSMQVYVGMDVGAAKPDADERARVPFHLLDVVPPDRAFTVADWKEKAETAISAIYARGNRPILCGGTGLYIRALLDDWSLAETPSSPVLRARLNEEAQSLGSVELHKRLSGVDPATAARLHPNDAVRIVRALEVFEITGTPLSEYQARDRATRPSRPATRIGLTIPRPELYARIGTRVDAMLAAGLEAEVRGLLERGYAPTLGPMRGLGYKEMVSYLSGEIDYTAAIESIKQNTRRFAKRQGTWFRADPLIAWHDVAALSSATVAEALMSLPALRSG